MSGFEGTDRPLVVVGDVTLDLDLVGRAERLSPEAAVPVIVDALERRRPGGAALAALLAAREHPRVILIAPLADDDAAREIRRLLAGRVEVLGLEWAGTTPVKTRVRAGDHPVTRLDSGGREGAIGDLPEVAIEALRSAAAVMVADYGRGATSHPALRDRLAEFAATAALVWDPHPRGAPPVPRAWLVTPNAAEAAAATGGLSSAGPGGLSTGGTPADPDRSAETGVVVARARWLRERWAAQAVAVTLGARGALLVSGSGAPLAVPAPAVRGGDTCGAGDAFAAAATVALARGRLPSEAVVHAVSRAAAFVAGGAAAAVDAGGEGTEPPGATEVDPAAALVRRVRAAGGRVVATGGCFDLLHAGHIATLQAARALGDCLVVCLNSDASIRRLKGSGRPLQSEPDRTEVLRALRFVDAVAVFEEDTPAEVLRRLRPDVWVKGGDYTGVDLPEAAVLAEWSGEVVTLPYLAGRSTSQLVDQARR